MKHFEAFLTQEVKVYLDDNNVDIRPIAETWLLRFHRVITNTLSQ